MLGMATFMIPAFVRTATATCLLAAALLGCNRPDEAMCRETCRHYGKLAYWDKANVDIDAAEPAARDALRAEKQKDFETRLEAGLTQCVMACKSSNSEPQSKCILEAQTLAAAKKCR